MMNSSNPIQHINIAEIDSCQIKNNIYVPSTHDITHVLCLSLDSPYQAK